MNSEWLMIIGMALVTFAVRYPLLVLVGRIKLSPTVVRALRYVPPAVLAAIITPTIIMPQGTIDISLNGFMVSGIVSILVAWRLKNLLLTIVIGMATLFIWQALFPPA
jgi:branched-subunit amino acid transport protein